VDHFGEEMISALDKLPVSAKVWRGPFRSEYGWHVVLMTARTPGRIPPLADLRKRVIDDYTVDMENQNRKASIARLVQQYRVTFADPALESGKGKESAAQ
jgi:parvulin-like peptidyl-prolyl isomerase